MSIFGKSDIFSGEKAENILKARQQDFGDNNNVEHKVEIESNQPVVKPDKTNKENVKPKQPNLFDDVDKGFDTVQAPANPKPQKVSLFDDDEEIKSDFAAKPKKISLFDDDDDLFKDDLFSGIDTKKFTSNLFDDVEDNSEDLFPGNVKKNEAPKIDLFCDLNGSSDASANKNILEPKTAFKPKKNLNLFEEEEEDLFGTKQTMPGTNISQDNTKTDDVKEEIVVSNRTVNADDEVDIDITKIVEDLPQRQVIGAEKLATERKATRGLFDDDLEENETEDLFKETEVKKKEDKAFGGNENLETGKGTLSKFFK